MKTKNKIFYAKLVILILPIIFGTGCSSGSGHVKVIKLAEKKISKYKTMIVNVISDDPESNREVIQLSSMIVAKLQEKNLFENIYLSQFTPDAVVDLNLNVKIVKLRKVSSAERSIPVIVGVLSPAMGILITAAGMPPEEIFADAQLINSNTGETISEFKVVGKSSGGGGTEISQAIERAAEKIAEFISENM